MLACDKQASKKNVAALMEPLTTRREDTTKQIFLLLDKELRDKDDADLKAPLQCLERIMLIQDDLQKQRVKSIFVLFLKFNLLGGKRNEYSND